MNSKLKPKIRFKGFTDDCEQRKFNEYINLRMGHLFSPSDYVKDGKYNVITISNVKGDRYIDISDVNTVDSLPSNINNYQILCEDDLLISLTGNIGRVSFNKGVNNILNYRVGKIEFGKKEICDKFIYAYLCQDSIIRSFIDKGQGGAQPNISKSEVENLSIMVPSIDEQIKIGRFFEILDNTITLHQRKCNKLIELKKSLLKKIFPQNNSLIPEIRFKGFSDDWEQRKLNSLSRNVGTGKSKYHISQYNKYAILGSRGVIGYDNNYDYSGDFILTARVGEYAGELYRYNGNVKITDNTVYIQGENLDYLYYLLKQYDLKKLSFGSGQPLVKASELSNLELKATKDSKEKEKISILFSNIDNLITLHQRKHDKLNKIKQSLLNDMFV